MVVAPYLGVLVVAVALLFVVHRLDRRKPRKIRGIIGHLIDGPEKGSVVAISLDGPTFLMRLVHRDDRSLMRHELFSQREDEELLRRAVRCATGPGHCPRWSYVRNIFGVGSSTAAELCRRFDVDPDELRGQGWDDEEADA